MTGLTVALAVSGHGFGHAVRSAQIAQQLRTRGARVLLRTDAPAWLFPETVELMHTPGWPLDVGVAQHDGLEFDIDETRQRWRDFEACFEPRADAEARILREYGVDMVVGDVPPLAFAAAARAGIPSIAVTNFGWDWIYSAWPDFDFATMRIRAAYASAERLLRLPLHATTEDAFPAFRTIEDVPLVARRGMRPRAAVRAELGIPMEAKVVLLSFAGFTADGLRLDALGRWRDYVFVITPPLSTTATAAPGNLVRLNESPSDYVSLLAACDVVVTKPGYGIVADCLANRVAVLFTDRGPFREYDVLADTLPRLGRAQYVPRAELLEGHLGPHLAALLASTTAWTEQPMNGAEVIAERVVRSFTIEQKSS